jgi:hypothetical protein
MFSEEYRIKEDYKKAPLLRHTTMSCLSYEQIALKPLLIRTKFPDVRLTTVDGQGKVIVGHKHILAAVSKRLEELFVKSADNDLSSVILVRNIRFKVLERIVDFVYLGTLDLKLYSEVEVEDTWDGLYMLRMKELSMGCIAQSQQFEACQDGNENIEASELVDVKPKIPFLQTLALKENSVVEVKKTERQNPSKEPLPALSSVKEASSVKSRKVKSKINPEDIFVDDSVHKATLKPHECSHCGLRYSRRFTLLRHQRFKNHPTSTVDNLVESQTFKKRSLKNKGHRKEGPLDVSTVKVFSCDICGVYFTFKANLKRHRLLKHNQIETFVGKSSKQAGVKNVKKYESLISSRGVVKFRSKGFRCYVCGLAYGSKSSLRFHERWKHGI